MTLAVSFATESFSTLLVAELRSAACSSWQDVAQVPARFQFARLAYPVKYRRVIVHAALASVEHASAVDHAQHLWLTAKT